MKLIYSSLLSICFWLIFSSAQAITIEQLQQQIAKYPTVKADFVLQKTMANFNIPFETSGKMIFDRKLGLWWQQTSPFSQTVKANQDRIKISMADGPEQVITRESQPQLFQLTKLVDAVFNGDMKTFNDNFTVVLTQPDTNTWQLQLTPKTASLKKIIQTITVEGDEFLQTIDVLEAKNGKTMIYFANHETTPLTAKQQNLFN